MSEVKWTHERILEELRRHSWASQAMGAMRDDMQATIDALRAASRITDAKLTGDLEMARDRLRELEQQLAALQAATPARTEALEYILANSLDEYNVTFAETQTQVNVLRAMLAEMKGSHDE